MSSRYYQTEHVSACSDCPCIWFKHGFQIDVLNLTCSRPFNTAAKMCPYNIGFWIKACVHKCSNQWRMCTNGKYFEWIFLFNCHTSLAVTLMLSLIRDTTHGPRITLQQPKGKIDFFSAWIWTKCICKTCGWIKNWGWHQFMANVKWIGLKSTQFKLGSNPKCQVNLSSPWLGDVHFSTDFKL